MKIFAGVMLLLILSTFSVGQGEVNSQCPAIVVSGPDDIVPAGNAIRFAARVGEGAVSGLSYTWTVSSGTIVNNGGPAIDVVNWNKGETVTATLDIEGLPLGCETAASVTAQPDCGPPPPTLIDEMEGPFAKVEQDRYNNILLALNNDPTARLHVIIYAKAPIIQATSKLAALRNSILKRFPVSNRDRISFTEAGISGPNAAKFYIVPAGAETPIP